MKKLIILFAIFLNISFSMMPSVNVGFNAKGNMSTDEQINFLEKELNKLKNNKIDTSKIWIRVNGGTISQKTYSSDRSDETIILWAKLQKLYDCKFIFVVNFNDTPEKQREFFDRFRHYNMKFSLIELGNEQYLKKFSQEYDEEMTEVTDRTANMTPKKYIEMSNEYMSSFIDQNLPFYVQMAPNSEEKENYAGWNNSVANAINKKNFISENIGLTLHLYERDGSGSLDVKQIDQLKKLIKHPINIAITEFGVVEKKKNLVSSKDINQEINLSKRILEQVTDGDLVLNQVLYTDYKDVGSANIHPTYNGLTPKGEAIFKLFSEYWE